MVYPTEKALPTAAGSFNIGIIELECLIDPFPAIIQFDAVNKFQIAMRYNDFNAERFKHGIIFIQCIGIIQRISIARAAGLSDAEF